jgi:hypothetical protein
MTTTTRLISNYTATLSPSVWNEVQGFVRSTVASLYSDAHPYRVAEHALAAMAGFADWLVFTGAGAPEASSMRADLIDSYTAFRKSEVSPAVSERERKLLRTLAGISNAVEQRNHSTNASAAVPYTADEQAAFRRWAESQPSQLRGHLATTLLALGLGCGLNISEMVNVRNGDVHTLSDGLVGVRVGQRLVPAVLEWADELQSVTGDEDADYLLRPHAPSRTVASLKESLRRFTRPAPSTQRMRASWLLAHVEAGTPVHVLIDAAGVSSSDVLRRVLPFAAPVAEDDYVRALRLGGEVVR